MAKVRWEFNIAGFAELRNHPTLVGAMEGAAEHAAAVAPVKLDVVTWPHSGRGAGPRTSVQIWARHPHARRRVNRDPGELLATLNRVGL